MGSCCSSQSNENIKNLNKDRRRSSFLRNSIDKVMTAKEKSMHFEECLTKKSGHLNKYQKIIARWPRAFDLDFIISTAETTNSSLLSSSSRRSRFNSMSLSSSSSYEINLLLVEKTLVAISKEIRWIKKTVLQYPLSDNELNILNIRIDVLSARQRFLFFFSPLTKSAGIDASNFLKLIKLYEDKRIEVLDDPNCITDLEVLYCGEPGKALNPLRPSL